MSEVTQILTAIQQGNRKASEELLPLVYTELRRLASAKLARENPGHTLQATALVHEAYLRLVDRPQQQEWDSRRHFFGAAAEAMRRILVESARRKSGEKRGGEWHRVELDTEVVGAESSSSNLLLVDDVIEKLAGEDPEGAELVKLRYFGGFSVTEAAEILGISRSSAYEQWAYVRAWLQCELESQV